MHLLALPSELIHRLASFLSLGAILALTTSSRQLQDYADEVLWQQLVARDYPWLTTLNSQQAYQQSYTYTTLLLLDQQIQLSTLGYCRSIARLAADTWAVVSPERELQLLTIRAGQVSIRSVCSDVIALVPNKRVVTKHGCYCYYQDSWQTTKLNSFLQHLLAQGPCLVARYGNVYCYTTAEGVRLRSGPYSLLYPLRARAIITTAAGFRIITRRNAYSLTYKLGQWECVQESSPASWSTYMLATGQSLGQLVEQNSGQVRLATPNFTYTFYGQVFPLPNYYLLVVHS